MRPPSSCQQRLAERLPDEIPDGDLGGPGAAAVKVDRLADLSHGLGAHRIEPDEELLQGLEIGEPVAARRHPRQSLVALDEDDRRVLMDARRRIPRGSERRVERKPVEAALDRRDPHSAAAVERVPERVAVLDERGCRRRVAALRPPS